MCCAIQGQCADVMEEVVQLVRTMKRVRLDEHFDVSGCGFLPGMFVLVAHDDATVRDFAQQQMLDTLSKLETSDAIDAVPGLWSLMERWVRFSEPPPQLAVLSVCLNQNSSCS